MVSNYRRAIVIDPSNTKIRYHLGQTYVAMDLYSQAASCLEEAASIDPKDVDIRIALGVSLSKCGRYQDAINAYELVIKLEPKSDSGYHNLAYLFATCPMGEFRDGRKALELAKIACDLTEYADANCLSGLAAAHAELGDFKKAIEWQEKAIGIATSFQPTCVGIVLSKIGQSVIVTDFLPGLDEDSSQVKTGDVIVAIGDLDTKEMSLEEIVDAIDGPKDTEMALTITRPGQAGRKTVTLARGEPKAEYKKAIDEFSKKLKAYRSGKAYRDEPEGKSRNRDLRQGSESGSED